MSSILDAGQRRSRLHFAFVGLPSVGKSTLVSALHGKIGEAVRPTEGCNKSNLHRNDLVIDILDLGGKMSVRKFWKQLASEADGLVVVANAAEADDLSWSVLGQEVRALREGRPVLILLNRREAPTRMCMSEADALDRLGLLDSGVHVEKLDSSSDIEHANLGIGWLCDEITNPVASRGASPASSSRLGSPSAARTDDPPNQGQPDRTASPIEDTGDSPSRPPPPSGSRMRALRGLRDARQYANAQDSQVEELQRRLIAGHILSEEELEMVRAAGR
jgi:hypothetical protein